MTGGSSRIISGRYPRVGTSPIADAIRARRGARGLTPLDGALLHVPPVAGGWNSLLGAIRTQGNLPGNVRELMILRVAAINHAAFEWIHHEHVGRDCGLNTAQLYVIRDTVTPLPPSTGILSELQTSALLFADASTREVKVNKAITESLTKNLEIWARGKDPSNVEERVEDLLVEAAAIVGTYNMVSRFLVSLDVAGMSDNEVPWPLERKEHFVTISSSPDCTHTIHAVTLITSPTSPWIVFANSLLTDLSMWGYLIPYLISDSYNILIHSQRGHGLSTLPSTEATTIPSLASDIANLLKQLNIPTPIHTVVGVSQGGAAAMSFGRTYHNLTRSVVICDTAAKTPAGNKEAWAGRIGMVYGGDMSQRAEYASKVGMLKLAEATVPRWFPSPSKCANNESQRVERARWLAKMVENTPVEGFVAGAGALSDYDLSHSEQPGNSLFLSPVGRVLLVAGSLDGNGKVGSGLKHLSEEWNAERCRGTSLKPLEYVEIEGSGHLPMIDETEQFAEVLVAFLKAL
ncbi:Alpha/Beta hydrolase protein [Collybia nuda]|uniref:Alpha/Beta hydrolase protein n=1 Tax=Collybia nuda TaxID=64659 RepID=A0A9P5Y680_9AGAR|nr:Alpha/Beta hydrolase protein [Collybia nuda]